MEQTHNVEASTLCPCGCTLPIESTRPETLGAGYCGCGCQGTLSLVTVGAGAAAVTNSQQSPLEQN